MGGGVHWPRGPSWVGTRWVVLGLRWVGRGGSIAPPLPATLTPGAPAAGRHRSPLPKLHVVSGAPLWPELRTLCTPDPRCSAGRPPLQEPSACLLPRRAGADGLGLLSAPSPPHLCPLPQSPDPALPSPRGGTDPVRRTGTDGACGQLVSGGRCSPQLGAWAQRLSAGDLGRELGPALQDSWEAFSTLRPPPPHLVVHASERLSSSCETDGLLRPVLKMGKPRLLKPSFWDPHS